MKKEILVFALLVLSLTSVSASMYTVDLQGGIGVKIKSPLEDQGQVSVMAISKTHYEIHEGDHYFIKTWLENNGASGSFNYFSFTTPENDVRIHAKSILFADTDTVFEIYEGSNITDGTPITGINNDRDSLNVAQLVAIAAPTVVDEGDLIFSGRTGGGREPVGISLSGNYEIIAKTNTTYTFKITKQTTADTIIDVDFFWYEEEQD